MDKGQLTRFSKGEMEIIRNTFKNEEVLYAIRNIFFGFPAEAIKLSDEALAIVKKIMIPELTPDVPFGQQADLYFSLNLKEIALPEVAVLHIQAKDLVTKYLLEKFETLKSGYQGNLTLESLKNNKDASDDDRYVGMLAYLFLTQNSYIDGFLGQLRTLANQKELTEKEKEELSKKNSSK